MSRRVLILHTGGTLGMRPREPDQALAPDEFGATLLEHVPEIERIAAVDMRVLSNVDSSDITPAHWLELARAIESVDRTYAGVVVTHGTDAMAYTASALSYLLRGLPFPVILTGSQRPLADVHTDGRANLVGATELALREIPEVTIYFDGHLLRGNRTVKSDTFGFGAFRSPNFPALAEMGTEIKLVTDPLSPEGPLRLEGRFDPRLAVVWLHPGASATALEALVDTDVRAVLVVAFGFGNLPVVDRSVATAIRALAQQGKVVAVGSQSTSGGVDLSRYAGGRLARESGAVGIGDMTLPAAAVKLMYLVGTLGDPERVRSLLSVPIAGEITV